MQSDYEARIRRLEEDVQRLRYDYAELLRQLEQAQTQAGHARAASAG
jgi:hypothetical protein